MLKKILKKNKSESLNRLKMGEAYGVNNPGYINGTSNYSYPYTTNYTNNNNNSVNSLYSNVNNDSYANQIYVYFDSKRKWICVNCESENGVTNECRVCGYKRSY